MLSLTGPLWPEEAFMGVGLRSGPVWLQEALSGVARPSWPSETLAGGRPRPRTCSASGDPVGVVCRSPGPAYPMDGGGA